MNKTIRNFIATAGMCLLALPALAQQADGYKVERDGKVFFTKTFDCGQKTNKNFAALSNWANSSTLYTLTEKSDPDAGIVSTWHEADLKLYTLQRNGELKEKTGSTRIFYKMTCQLLQNQCEVTISDIQYPTTKKRRTAEERISDAVALNKKKNTLVKRWAPWRLGTMKYMEELLNEAGKVLNTPASEDGIISIDAQSIVKQTVENVEKSITQIPVTELPEEPQVYVSQPVPLVSHASYKEVKPTELTARTFPAGQGEVLISVKKDGYYITVIAKGGASIAKVGDMMVVHLNLTSGQNMELMETAEAYDVRFFPAKDAPADFILGCKPINDGSHTVVAGARTFTGKILKAQVKK